MAANSTYKFEAHGPWVIGSYKTYCQGCGLVRLNNDFTNWAIKHGCNNRDHPGYEAARSSLAKPVLRGI
jgi:hypothetical protein